ncbi:hypothetical protein CI109_103181 [Kwoniella shandongensis]|uniref:Uncharacterized protein n=1 Tax=Kwoniella shandongensis TaxID=1734106 RepID=A0A5M6CAA2_9TREE|nr:uncharacterized protein CI109_000372 [Kwoniella shandongensis]KAA5531530.1 hypothetical protein CI109_000372 [Kwoniella shandongensis]
MARKRSGNGKAGVSSGSKAASAPGARINKMERYEDTIEPGSVDDFMFKRDQINFNPQNDSDDEDINANEGEEVLSLNRPRPSNSATAAADQEEEDDDEAFEDELPKKKERKTKSKADVSTKGRFGKPIEMSDDDEDDDDASGSGSEGSSDEDDEAWGRQYYSRPSNRREKEKEGVVDEQREEEREMEEREVRRLQKKQREVLGGEDFGLVEDDGVIVPETKAVTEEEMQAKSIPAPPSSANPAALLRHLQAHEPLKLALARDFPLIVRKLRKTARGIKKMEEEADGEGELHKGLGWLHYQTLLTYATTLAFYIHLSSLPSSSRPDIPVIPRLLQLKEGIAMLEDLDFAAGSVSDGAVVLTNRDMLGEDEDDEEDLKDGKAELMKRMSEVNGMEWEDEADDLWQKEGLEAGELEALLRDAGDGDSDEEEEIKAMTKKSKKAKKGKKKVPVEEEEIDDFDDLDLEALIPTTTKKDKSKKKVAKKAVSAASSTPAFTPLAEPEFFTSSKKSKTSASDDADPLGDPTALADADYTDKQAKKRSLAFHTSKINSTLARRAEGRANRMGGDEDLPYRDRRKARDDALKRNGGPRAEGEDLEDPSSLPVTKEKKRARDEVEDDGEGGEGSGDEAEGYYELVKRRRTEEKEAKDAEHEAYQEEMLAARAGIDDESADGPRALTRAIEKNRGLTPHRSKTGRNPRVKKRLAYEKAKKKVASQRSVYKGGQAAYGGAYKGEKTGISKVIKSRKF